MIKWKQSNGFAPRNYQFIALKGNAIVNTNNCDSKMCKSYFLLCNLPVPSMLGGKREVVLKHEQSMKNDLNGCNKASTQPLTCSFWKLVWNIMTVVDWRKLKLCTRMKQCLNAFNSINILIKKLINDRLDKYRSVSIHKNLNIGGVINYIDFSSLIKHTWEAN